MTRREVERMASLCHELAVASIVGAGGDLIFVGTRFRVDAVGFGIGLLFLWVSLRLTRRLGGPRI
jgi:hypothetical protein